jgi:hypothetical protein
MTIADLVAALGTEPAQTGGYKEMYTVGLTVALNMVPSFRP